jgi:hypothetical protein
MPRVLCRSCLSHFRVPEAAPSRPLACPHCRVKYTPPARPDPPLNPIALAMIATVVVGVTVATVYGLR